MNIKKTWEIEKEIDTLRDKLKMSDSIKKDAQFELEKERFAETKWVTVDDLIKRIETICNHGNERDMRFRNQLFEDLQTEPDGQKR